MLKIRPLQFEKGLFMQLCLNMSVLRWVAMSNVALDCFLTAVWLRIFFFFFDSHMSNKS